MRIKTRPYDTFVLSITHPNVTAVKTIYAVRDNIYHVVNVYGLIRTDGDLKCDAIFAEIPDGVAPRFRQYFSCFYQNKSAFIGTRHGEGVPHDQSHLPNGLIIAQPPNDESNIYPKDCFFYFDFAYSLYY